MNTDPIADMLTRIRNANMARKDSLVMPYSKMKESIAKILCENGFVPSYTVDDSGKFKQLAIKLNENRQVITSLVRVSKPGRRLYVSVKDIPLIVGGRGIVILSTSSGVMAGREARKKGLGGELIAKVW
jgi:small subunit ribosomal protein S8